MKRIVVIIKASSTCYLARGWNGDPPRTHDISKARIFNSIISARRAIYLAKLTHPYTEREYDVELLED